MTLDEAIRRTEIVAESKEKQVKNGDWEKDSLTERDCIKSAEEHRQLAEWFKDYKRLKEQEPSDDCISRQAVEDKLLKLCNELEGIFANIRMQNQDESVCGLCEYDCPAPYECPGFDTEDCFKLAYEIRYKWQSTEDLHSVKPQESCDVPDINDGKMSESPTDSKDVIWYSKRNYSEIVVEPQEGSEA